MHPYVSRRLTETENEFIMAKQCSHIAIMEGMPMDKLPQVASISELRNKHLEVFKRLESGPVMLASRNQPQAVLVSPDQWDAIVERIDDLECIIAALEAELAIERGEATIEPANIKELEAMARGEPISA
jgi:prevent-host-death family protein